MSKEIQQWINKIHLGNTLEVLKQMPSDFVDTIVTSPPYWGLRNYNVEGQLGLEKTLEEYLKKLLVITLELKRVLKPTGVLYWNHGDSYCGGHPGGSIHGEITGDRYNESNIPQKSEGRPQGNMENYQEKCLIMQNERLAIKMVDEQGWILRNRIIWYKPNAMPSSVKDRFKNSYEPVYMFVKARRYYFDLDAVRLPHKTESLEKYQRQINVGLDGGNRDSKYLGTEFDGVLGGKRTPLPNWFVDSHKIDKDYKEEIDERQQNLLGEDIKKEIIDGPKYAKGSEFEKKYGEPWDRFGKNTKKANKFDISKEQKEAVRKEGKVGSAQRLESFFDKYGGKTNPMGKNPGDLWEISTHPFPDAHFATFPEKLIEPMILSSCPKWICKKCGKARIRIIEKEEIEFDKCPKCGKEKQKRYDICFDCSEKLGISKGLSYKGRKIPRNQHWEKRKTEPIGWTDCKCNADWEAGIVLDPFLGSGTVAIVAKKLGFNWIGIEINPEYVKMAEGRINAQTKPLF